MTSSPRELALLINPTAGKGRGRRAGLLALHRLRAAGHVVRSMEGRDADEALDLARSAVAEGLDGFIACGGDGLVNLAVQALASTDVPLGVIPTGTGNDVARMLGLPRTDPEAAASRVLAGHTRTIDLARCGQRYFVTVLAAGFDALVNERANRMRRPRGQLRYTLATLAELRHYEPRPYVLDLDGRVSRLTATLVAVGNGPSFGGGLRITEGARLDDGLLDVAVVRPLSRFELVRTYPRLFRGTHVSHPQYEKHRVRSVTVAAPEIVGYADGERFGPLPLTIECAPAALRVFA